MISTHRMLSIAAGLTAAVVVAPSTAQKTFDLILPTAMEHPVFSETMRSTHVGLLVNTGTQNISEGELQNALFNSHSSKALARCEFVPSFGNWSVLKPGEAVGSNGAIYRQLLKPGETVISGGFGAYFVRCNDTVGTQTKMTTHMVIGGRRSRSVIDVTFVESSKPFRVLGVQRVSGSIVKPAFETMASGCAMPTGYKPWIGPDGAFNPVASNTSVKSNLPVLGNSKFVIRPGGAPRSEIGRPYVIHCGYGDRTIQVLGCELIIPKGTLGSGVVTAFRRTGRVRSVAAPIPNIPGLAGTSIGVQWFLLTPRAANGVGVASRGLRLNLFAGTDN